MIYCDKKIKGKPNSGNLDLDKIFTGLCVRMIGRKLLRIVSTDFSFFLKKKN